MLSKIYNNSVFAVTRGNAFAAVVKGPPGKYFHWTVILSVWFNCVNISGSGKSQILVETINALVRYEANEKKVDLKILVTGPSDDVVDALARSLHRYRSDRDQSGKQQQFD